MGSGVDDNGEVNGEKVYRMFVVEFTYKTDYVGVLTAMTIMTYNRDKYYVTFAGRGANLNRKDPYIR